MNKPSTDQNFCPRCSIYVSSGLIRCTKCGYEFDNSTISQVNLTYEDDLTVIDKYPWIGYLGYFGLAGILFGMIIFLSWNLIGNVEQYLVNLFWVTQAVSGGVISLLVGIIHLLIFKQEVNRKYYLLFLVASLLSGIFAGYFSINIFGFSQLDSAIQIGLVMGAISGGLASVAQGLFIFNKKSKNYTKVLLKWVLYHVVSWSVIWGIGWVVSWSSNTATSLALSFLVIMLLSGLLFVGFLKVAGAIDYA